MAENLDLTKILEGCEGINVYYTVYGECKLNSIAKEGDINLFLVDIKSGRSIGSLKKNGKRYDTGECLLYPSRTQRDWSKFEKPYKDGAFVIADGRKCIFKAKDDDGYIDVHVVISRSDDRSPDKMFIRDGELQQLVKGDNMRLANVDEIRSIKQRLTNEGYEWDDANKRIVSLRWRPSDGGTYFYIDVNMIGDMKVGQATWSNGEIDLDRYKNGNVFENRVTAEEWKNKFREISNQLKNRK